MSLFLDSVFYSYAQIFFSNRKWFGIAAMVISFFDPQVGAMGLLGVILSNAFALYLNFDKDKIRNGFYGFNGILIGGAVAYFFQLTPFVIGIAVIFIFLTFFVSASLEHLMATVFNLPGLSLPFILTLYVFLIVVTEFNGVLYRDFLSFSSAWISEIPNWANYLFSSLALILLQSKAIAGLFVLLIILIFSRVMFLNTLIAFSFNYLLIYFIFPQASYSFLILTSFNAILTAFALGGSMIIISRKTIPLLLLNIFFVLVFALFFEKILSERLLPVLVLPFNIITLSTIYSLKFRHENTDLTLLYFEPGSPEENYYYHKTRVERFSKFKLVFPELPFMGVWKITQAFDGKHTHKNEWKYAWDFELTDEEDSFFETTGKEPTDYYCYNTPVIAPYGGKVVRVIDGINDNKIGDVNLEQNWGNTIILSHGDGLYSSLSHLKRKSILVKEGDEVKKGEVLARCGNSGRSPQPHLHFQFQLTDKLGDKTYKFPFAHFIAIDENGNETLRIFDYPSENEKVKNIDTHKTVKNAFTFKLGDELIFDCTIDEKHFSEKWVVSVDMLNTLYIHNDNGDRLNIYPTDKIFYATNYVGKKQSALYAFYLSASKVLLGYSEKLIWEDVFPVNSIQNSPVRFASEFFLPFAEMLQAKGEYRWNKDEADSFELLSKLNVNGKGLFSFYSQEGYGKISLNEKNGIDEISLTIGKRKFFIKRGEKKNEERN